MARYPIRTPTRMLVPTLALILYTLYFITYLDTDAYACAHARAHTCVHAHSYFVLIREACAHACALTLQGIVRIPCYYLALSPCAGSCIKHGLPRSICYTLHFILYTGSRMEHGLLCHQVHSLHPQPPPPRGAYTYTLLSLTYIYTLVYTSSRRAS